MSGLDSQSKKQAMLECKVDNLLKRKREEEEERSTIYYGQNRGDFESYNVTFKQMREKIEKQDGSDLKANARELYDKYFDGRQSRHCYMSGDGKFIYHLGIIDYLQDFNVDKWAENKFKSIISDGEMISAVPPRNYCLRYYKFMTSQVIINQSAEVDKKDINFETIVREFKRNNFTK